MHEIFLPNPLVFATNFMFRRGAPSAPPKTVWNFLHVLQGGYAHALGLHRLIRGPCRPTELPLRPNQGPLRPTQGLVGIAKDLLGASEELLEPNAGLQFT